MTQTTARPVAPARGPAAPPGQPGPYPPLAADRPGTGGRARTVLAGLFQGSPGRLRLAGIGAVLACLVFALLGAAAYQARLSALSDANADAAQLIRVQQIATEVVHADSILTSGFPSPQQQTAAQLADFDASLSNAAQLVAEASGANPADSAELAQVADALGQYQEYAADARSANGDHKQVAYGYLRQAAAALRGQDQNNPNLITGTGMLPALNQLISANQQRVDDAYSSSTWATVEMIVAGLVALGGLIAVQVWLARRTRRYLNVPLVAGTVAVLVVAVVGAVLSIAAASRADQVRSTSYAELRSLAGARIAANAAKSDASISFLYLRTGGSSATYQKDFAAQLQTVQAGADAITDQGLNQQAESDFKNWKAAATATFTATQDNWANEAKSLADPASSFNQPFTDLDQQLRSGIDAQARAVDSGLGSGNGPLMVLVWVALVVGLLAAVAGWAGIAQRLEDYR